VMCGRRLRRSRWFRVIGLFAIAIIIIFCGSSTYRSLLTMPDTVRLVSGADQEKLLQALPVQICVRAREADDRLLVNGRMLDESWLTLAKTPLQLQADAAGISTLELRLFGLLPVRRVTVETLDPVELTPAGHAIGVILRSEGVMVLDHLPVTGSEGTTFPARDSGIRPGDLIEEINGRVVQSKDHLAEEVEKRGLAGEPLEVTIRRNEDRVHLMVWPRYDVTKGEYRVGLTVRDGTAGVGTLTAYCPEKMRFLGLGHEVSDPRTGLAIPLREGHIVSASISDVTQARDGTPGEKVGVFSPDDAILGVIESNTPVGIAGRLERTPDDRSGAGVPVALQDQIVKGEAEMWTVIEGGKLESFQVEIKNIRSQQNPEGKSMVVRVTDPELIARTGGIVQGMSGSPILQNDRLVGAVTHVFVNDPARGYAIHAEWIAAELGLVPAVAPGDLPPPLRGVASFTQ